MTYYRLDFVAAKLISRPAKRFRTEEKAKKHARRVLGVADDGDLGTRVAIVAVSRTEPPVWARTQSLEAFVNPYFIPTLRRLSRCAEFRLNVPSFDHYCAGLRD